MEGAIFFSSDFFAEVRTKAAGLEWAGRALEKLAEATRARMARPLDIPLQGGGWSHNYNCPNDGDRLRLIDRHHHRCETCGSVWSGTPWDEVAVANEHWQFGIGCRDAAVLYALTDDGVWAGWAKRILLFYAEHYEQYPLHDVRGGTAKTAGKVQCQTLSESSWIVPLAQAFYILNMKNAWSPEEQTGITDRLFMPAIEVIKRHSAGMSNWQTYHNAAKAWIGAATGQRSLFDEALHMADNGFYYQMEHSLGDDGFWYEGAWGYHFYTLEAQVLIMLAGLCFGEKLYEHQRFQLMFDAPLACMFPDGNLPPVHDSSEVSVQGKAHLYELSFRLWGQGRELLARSDRSGLYALLLGVHEIEGKEKDEAVVTTSIVDLKRAGMLFVKQAGAYPATEQAAMIDYGPHGGGHGHRDKLNLLYYAGGRPWLTDAGMLPYGNPVHSGYFKQTVAHNTVAVGGKSQDETEGTLLSVRKIGEGIVEWRTESRDAYPGAIIGRKTILTPDFVVDWVYAQCEEPTQIDWIVHTQGVVSAEDEERYGPEPLPDGALGAADGYGYLKSIRRLNESKRYWRLNWQWDRDANAEQRLDMYGFEATGPAEKYIAESPAMPSIGSRNCFIRRASGQEALFITVFRTCRQKDAPLNVVFDGDAGLFTIETPEGLIHRFGLHMETEPMYQADLN